jgi:5'-phosphate synthase pdxT subunit
VAGKTVGVLALQGDYERHLRALESAGAHPVEVRTAAELAAVDALVLPGGESTTMLKLLHREGLFEPLAAFGREKPIFGTCGRQLDSRVVTLPSALGDLEAVFIRAPIIRAAGPAVNVLATYNDDPVLVEQGRHLVATFHPELTVDPRVHAYFLTKL